MATTPSSADKVMEALADQPGATAAELAEASGVGRSTANKALAALESERRVTRTPGARDAGRRLPDRWNVAIAHIASSPRRSLTAEGSPGTSPRLGKGGLRAMVLDHLRGHPGEALTPSAVAKVLGRSAGAVGNALVKLTVEGTVTQAGDSPRRYSYRG